MSNYGLSVIGNIRVFVKSKDFKDKNSKKEYTITDVWFNVSEKEEDGNYFNKSMNLIFKRGAAIPDNNTVINIISAFPIITGSGNFRRIALFVQDWTPVMSQAQQAQAHLNGQTLTITDEDIPF